LSRSDIWIAENKDGFPGDEMRARDNQRKIHLAAVQDLRKWRAVQLSSLLPAILCVVIMLSSREPSGLGAIAFFLLVAAGIVIPEMKIDIALNRFIIKKEQLEISTELRQLLREELQHLLKEPVIRDLGLWNLDRD
jgi:hypothetical protein